MAYLHYCQDGVTITINCDVKQLTAAGTVLAWIGGSSYILNRYKDDPDKIKQLVKEAIIPIGLATAVIVREILKGSFKILLEIHTLEALEYLWKSYNDGELQKKLQKPMITDELYGIAPEKTKELELSVFIDETEYRSALGILVQTESATSPTNLHRLARQYTEQQEKRVFPIPGKVERTSVVSEFSLKSDKEHTRRKIRKWLEKKPQEELEPTPVISTSIKKIHERRALTGKYSVGSEAYVPKISKTEMFRSGFSESPILQFEREPESEELWQEIEDLLKAEQRIQKRVEELFQATKEKASKFLENQSRDWMLARDEVTLTYRVISSGKWEEVVEGTFYGSPVAVQRFDEVILSYRNGYLVERKMSMRSRCRHPCLLQFIGATVDDDKSPLFVWELLDTSLRDVLHQRSLEPEEISIIALDTAKALNYLHLIRPDPIIHRNINSGNVLLWKRNNSWRAKVSDYGIGNFVQQFLTTRMPRESIYLAPEDHFSGTETTQSDVYSYGILLCEMSIKEQPDPSRRNLQVGMVTNQCHRELIERCLAENPDDRPNMGEVIDVLERCGEKRSTSVKKIS